MKRTFEIKDTEMAVTKKDGSSVTVNLSEIPAKLVADFFTDGVAEYIRDSSSAALAQAFDAAHSDHELEGAELIAARKAWGASNAAAVATQSTALMEDAIQRLYAGERRKARESSGPALTPEAEYTYSLISHVSVRKNIEPLAKAWADSQGKPTGERKGALLAALPDAPEAFRNYIDKQVADHFAMLESINV